MNRIVPVILGCIAGLATPILCRAEKVLLSPWDLQKIQVTKAAYACPEPLHLSPDLTTSGFYSDSKSSIIDPVKWKAYSESAGPYKKLGDLAVSAADAYRATGSKQAAECVLRLEKTAALDKVFTGKMSSNQAYFVQGWVIGALGIAYLKIRDSGVVGGEDRKLLTSWMQAVSKQTMDYYDASLAKPGRENGNNHLYWAGVQVGAIAIAANDRRMFDWALAAYRNGVRQITPEGTLPEEMRRGQRALHYHLYAASPLVYIAEFGEDNGIDLYGESNGALRLLVQRATAGLAGSGYFDQQAGIKQDAPNGPPTGEEIGWAKVYVKRFPDAGISSLIAKAPSLSYMYLGGLPPY